MSRASGRRWSRVAEVPLTGVGVGLRPAHYDEVLARRPELPFFEVISENFLGLREGHGGRPLEVLERVRESWPVVLHGVSMNLGSADPLDRGYLRRLRALADRVRPAWVSDHLCWTGVAGENLHDLLPLPFTREALLHVSERVQRAQDYLGRRILVENVSSYLTYAHAEMREQEFLAELARRTGCGLLLDVNNVYVSAVNQGFDAREYLRGIPRGSVGQMHVAGYSTSGPVLIDTHDHPVSQPVLELYADAVRRFGRVPTLLERDDRLPPLAELLREADAIAEVQRQSLPAAQEPPAPARVPEIARAGAPELARMQRWMSWMITHPRGIRAALEGAAGPARAEEPRPRLLESVADHPPVPREDRLGIYSDAYFLRILDSLGSDFRALRRALGAEAFRALAADFLLEHRSRSTSLANLGEDLPPFLAGHALSQKRPFLADLARLEQLALRAILTGRSPIVDVPRDAALEEWLDARVELDPTVALFDTMWPLAGPWRDRELPEGEGLREPARKRRTRLLIFRDARWVQVRQIGAPAWRALLALHSGATLGEVAEELPVLRWFGGWVREGVVAAVRLARGEAQASSAS